MALKSFITRSDRGTAPSTEERVQANQGLTGRGRKFVLIWLCLFAPLSLNKQMKTSAAGMMNTTRAVLPMLALLCAALFALSFSGCANTYYDAMYKTPGPESRYDTYYAPYYYPYYPWYAYYGGAYYYGVIR